MSLAYILRGGQDIFTLLCNNLHFAYIIRSKKGRSRYFPSIDRHLLLIDFSMQNQRETSSKTLKSGVMTVLHPTRPHKPAKIQKTSKSTTRQPMLSKSTTRELMLSKSLCHIHNHAFRHVPIKRYFHDYFPSFFSPKPRKSPNIKPFPHTQFSTLDINTTVSTCVVNGNMSTGWIAFIPYPPVARIARSLASVAGSQET